MTIEEKREKNRLKNIEWRKKNREKCCQATADWRARNPEYGCNLKLKKRYGITPEQYTEMLKKQDGKCAICGQSESAINFNTDAIQRLSVDHSHSTGKVRELLCQDCNRGIGLFHDDISRLEGAIKYLLKYR